MTSTNYTGKADESNRNCSCTYWIRDDGRAFITDPNGEILNLARLTAYAEYGKAIHDAHAHHEIPLVKIDAPKFVDAVQPGEHLNLNHQDTLEADGFPVVRADP